MFLGFFYSLNVEFTYAEGVGVQRHVKTDLFPNGPIAIPMSPWVDLNTALVISLCS
jgi:hypothetical protein